MRLAGGLRENARRLDLTLGAIQLARNLQAEIQAAKPDDPALGPEYDEQNRSAYDSANDYHNFSAEAFTDRAGHTYEGYRAEVKTQPGRTTGGRFQPEAGGTTYRITIKVYHDKKKLHQVQWLY